MVHQQIHRELPTKFYNIVSNYIYVTDKVGNSSIV